MQIGSARHSKLSPARDEPERIASTLFGCLMYEVRCWSESEWLQAKDCWDQLLANSSADALFSSWDWQTLWWQHFGRSVAADLRIYAFYENGDLVGLAPFYMTTQRRKGVLTSRSLQLIGSHWRDPNTLISEYLGLITHRSHTVTLQRECVHHLLSRDDWNEMIIACTPDAVAWRQAIRAVTGESGGYTREVDGSWSYQADLSAGFQSYLSCLGGSTRRALWNLRRRLEQSGAGFTVAVQPDIENAFAELNRLHKLRWGEPVFTGPRLRFHLDLAERLAGMGRLHISQTKDARGRTIAVTYDIRVAERQYNLQLGLDAGVLRASPGLLHFGYVMEQAAQSGVCTYDFLAGPGLRTNYKQHLAQHRKGLASVQFLRNALLSTLYRWHDRRRRGSGYEEHIIESR